MAFRKDVRSRMARGGPAHPSSPASRPLNRQRPVPQKAPRASMSHPAYDTYYDPYAVPDDDEGFDYDPSDVKMKVENRYARILKRLNPPLTGIVLLLASPSRKANRTNDSQNS